jgi:hypothetical protein
VKRAGLLLLACGLTSFAAAEPPAGAYAIEVGAADGLVLPAGTFDESGPGPDGLVGFAGEYETSVAGAITGSAGLTLDDPPFSLEAALELEGQMAGSTLFPKASLTLVGTGSAAVPDPNDPNDPNLPTLEFDVEASGRMRCKLDLETLDQLLCKGKVRLCVFDDEGVKRGCENVRLAIPLAFDPVPFEIQLELATSESSEVTGSGAVVIDAAPAFAYTAVGRYKPSADTTNLKLASADPLLKTTVVLKKAVFGGGGATGGVALFKVAGQKGRVRCRSPSRSRGTVRASAAASAT